MSAHLKDCSKPLLLAEAARYLRLGPETLKRKARAGQIPCARLGRSYRFIKEQLDDWLLHGGDQQRRDGTQLSKYLSPPDLLYPPYKKGSLI